MSQVQVIIPIYHPDAKFTACLRALQQQKGIDFSLLVIDSGSEQSVWREEASKMSAQVIAIDAADFNHGGTRQMGMEQEPEADVYCFLTQDAIPADENALACLVAAFDAPQVGCAYGRQLPHAGASLFATHARAFNYPTASRTVTFADRTRYGIKTAFCSNSFAAYRRKAMQSVGGFPTHTILSEDMYEAARMLQQGWSVAYVADACVYHSHDYSVCQEFHRYFDIGVFHSREAWIRETFGQAEGEGSRFVRDELEQILRHEPWLLPAMFLRDGAKFLGYRLGLLEQHLPQTLCRMLAMNKAFYKELSMSTTGGQCASPRGQIGYICLAQASAYATESQVAA